jgi:microcystin-dependent protein
VFTEKKEASMEPFVGQLMLVPYNFAPRGWLPCDGRALSIAQNTALFSLLGTTYGGDGQTTFKLPDLRGRTPVSVGQGSGLSNYSLGQAGGVESVALSVNQMPAHNHLVGASASSFDEESPGGNFLGGGSTYQTANADVTMNPAMVQPAGESQPHENRPPFLALQWLIATEGIFPTRP